MIRAIVVVGLLALGAASHAAAEEVVEIVSRPPLRVRALLATPEKPRGSVILLAGGHGNLALTRDGRIGWGRDNHLVRSRAMYAAAGFVTLVPDVAPDLKDGRGVRQRYRWSEPHAQDIGAMVGYLRAIAPPVILIGTSRAAISAAHAAARLAGNARPDALVLTSGMLMDVEGGKPSVERVVGGLARITQPVLLVAHADDTCAFTPPAALPPFRTLLRRAARVDSVVLHGGPAGRGDPCEPFGHHGFIGQDAEVVAAITQWIGRLK
jgi:hypothetical protein